jgi:predicted CXXCH cytochrome family protein
MKRLSRQAVLLSVVLFPSIAVALDPHLDSSLLPTGCATCHQGHGEPGSPMLPAPLNTVCLSCHSTQADLDRQVREGRLSASARPVMIAEQLSQPFVHLLSDQAYSRHEPGVVVCTSCHSPHRASAGRNLTENTGRAISTRDPAQFEYELCESCHGNQGVTTRSVLDISRLFDANSRSYHPVKVPAREDSPSLLPDLSGGEIDCTQCHGAAAAGPQDGVHGSPVRHLLRSTYTTVDGQAESESTYALCYECHQREAVTDSVVFPEHGLHIVELRASCATCHNPHGSVENRALIRFGEEANISAVSPSMSTGRLGFESEIPGEGACYVTCHGVDHGPGVYGGGSSGLATPDEAPAVGADGSLFPGSPRRKGKRDLIRGD